jgi:hypothetical protein
MQALLKNIEKTAGVLGLEPEELQIWLDQYQNLTPFTQIQVLRMATKYQLDPLSQEIGIMETLEGHQAFITIDGWVKLINSHEQYAGMSLREPQKDPSLEKEASEWMECTIYRHDRILPIVIREYLDEVKSDHPSWQHMPKRMLRHRVIQQCARLAFGINDLDSIAKNTRNSSNHKNINSISETVKNHELECSRSELLKSILKK